MKIKCVLLSAIVFFTVSCNTKFSKADAEKIIRNHYEMEKTKAGGGMEDIDKLTIIKFNDSNPDTPKASFHRIGNYIPNQVPGAAPSSTINDTMSVKFYKKEDKWEWKYDFE